MAKMTTPSKTSAPKSKVIRTGAMSAGKTPVKRPFPSNASGNRNGNKRQAPSVTVS